ncbi:MAG: thiolase family protein [Opitutus sp.]|nr:thiolase family protein [Opitutus sp.]MCS6246341.1 thiolase family protein [Opitutus sp.]MCS6273188.1 thiolase family protein [Opitutus sp.]MCS6278329.1 thiolase family protein [Opitutus sp.]MCS6299439.1 thiolase family protein [Opitutus sp.]
MKTPLYIVAGARTPFCKMGTELASSDAVELGRTAVAAVLAKTGIDPALINEVIFGCVGQPLDAANVSRVIALRAGIPSQVTAITVHRNCASGFEAITQAAEKIAAGRGDIFLVGGAESMSNYPLIYNASAVRKFSVLSRAKSLPQKLAAFLRFRPADFSPQISLMLGLTDPVCGLNMGQTAELLARDWRLSREQQDQFALRSHLNAGAARDRHVAEITPVYPRNCRAPTPAAITQDNGVRAAQTIEALQKLRPLFDRLGGTVTAGNASQVTDGACALLVMSEAGLKRTGLTPIGRLIDYAYAGCEPARMGLGPLYAIAKAEERSGLTMADADLIEINEAFAAQVLACQAGAKSADYARAHLGRTTALGEIPDAKLNVNGGGIALGHPVGSTGARLVLTSLLELQRRKARRALVSLCIGGGQGGALWLEAA